jgi:hypothetical protein
MMEKRIVDWCWIVGVVTSQVMEKRILDWFFDRLCMDTSVSHDPLTYIEDVF